jgi:hypothetical protein
MDQIVGYRTDEFTARPVRSRPRTGPTLVLATAADVTAFLGRNMRTRACALMVLGLPDDEAAAATARLNALLHEDGRDARVGFVVAATALAAVSLLVFPPSGIPDLFLRVAALAALVALTGAVGRTAGVSASRLTLRSELECLRDRLQDARDSALAVVPGAPTAGRSGVISLSSWVLRTRRGQARRQLTDCGRSALSPFLATGGRTH